MATESRSAGDDRAMTAVAYVLSLVMVSIVSLSFVVGVVTTLID